MTFNCCSLSLKQGILMGTVKFLPLVFSAIKLNAWCWAGINQWSQWSQRYTEARVPYFTSSAANLHYQTLQTGKHAVWILEVGMEFFGEENWRSSLLTEVACPGANENWQITPQEKKNLLTKITTMQINMIHKRGEDLCGCFPHPFHLASFFFVLLPNDAHLSASLSAASPSSHALLWLLGHMGLHLPGFSPFPLRCFWWQSSCCSWGSSLAHLFMPLLCQRWSPHSTGTGMSCSPALQLQQVIALVLCWLAIWELLS